VRAVFSTRIGGVSVGAYAGLNLGLHVGDDPAAVAKNRRLVGEALGATDIRSAVQVHGIDVAVEPRDAWGVVPPVTEADALVTAEEGVGLAVMVADCAPVVLASPGAVAVVHAGWRGLVGGVLERTLDELERLGAPATRAALGPCIGPCCFEVGEEVAEHFLPEHVQGRPEWPRPYVDVRAAIAVRLRARGVDLDVLDVCTSCDDRCFSHRRDAGRTGRQAVVAVRGGAAGRLPA
jgi:polyphenol oxidase